MNITFFVNVDDIRSFLDGQPVHLWETSQAGIPFTGPVDDFEIIDLPKLGAAGYKMIRWRSAGKMESDRKQEE